MGFEKTYKRAIPTPLNRSYIRRPFTRVLKRRTTGIWLFKITFRCVYHDFRLSVRNLPVVRIFALCSAFRSIWLAIQSLSKSGRIVCAWPCLHAQVRTKSFKRLNGFIKCSERIRCKYLELFNNSLLVWFQQKQRLLELQGVN